MPNDLTEFLRLLILDLHAECLRASGFEAKVSPLWLVGTHSLSSASSPARPSISCFTFGLIHFTDAIRATVQEPVSFLLWIAMRRNIVTNRGLIWPELHFHQIPNHHDYGGCFMQSHKMRSIVNFGFIGPVDDLDEAREPPHSE